jgi:hypothetical protein
MTEESEFVDRVVSWIERLVEHGERDFASLVSRLPGVDPIYVATTLKRLGDSGGGRPYQLLRDQACHPAAREPEDAAIPFVPHPLDFDWRFTPTCALEIASQVFALAEAERITLLGTPTLITALESHLPPSAIRLFDKNLLWRDRFGREDPSLNVTASDLTLDDLAVDTLAASDVVVMDPPWYPSIQRAYVWAATQLIRPGGFVLTTAPPQGTRPRVLAERAEIEAYADTAGLVPVRSCEGSVRYVTPPFEVNAMRAAGVFRSLPEWRSGDLIIYQSHRVAALERPAVALPGPRWREVMIRGIRIKMRFPSEPIGETASSPELEPLVQGDVLPSVSARHPVRELVDVWTSGNRIFKCQNTPALLELCEPLRHNAARSEHGGAKRAQSSMDSDASKRALGQVLAIVATESNEYLSGR